jgi:iron complex outermembrane recepter protein
MPGGTNEQLETAYYNVVIECCDYDSAKWVALSNFYRPVPNRCPSIQPNPSNTMKDYTKQRALPELHGLLAVLMTSVALVSTLVAQTRSAPGDPSRDETVELSPFIVSTNQDVGYLASNTLAGSRLNTPLRDTAASISVLTSEFLSDIGAFDISEAMSYAVNVEYQRDDDRATTPNGNETVGGYQGYRVRGLTASVSQNYFRTNIPAESALIERIEDARGPNSVLFGIASPGGLINSMTKQAQFGRSFRKASITAGSYESWRTASISTKW